MRASCQRNQPYDKRDLTILVKIPLVEHMTLLCFLCSFLGEGGHRLRDHYWKSWGQYKVLGIEPRSTAFKASALFMALSFQFIQVDILVLSLRGPRKRGPGFWATGSLFKCSCQPRPPAYPEAATEASATHTDTRYVLAVPLTPEWFPTWTKPGALKDKKVSFSEHSL